MSSAESPSSDAYTSSPGDVPQASTEPSAEQLQADKIAELVALSGGVGYVKEQARLAEENANNTKKQR